MAAAPSGCRRSTRRPASSSGARFLPFDTRFYTFPASPNKVAQRAAIKRLNEDIVRFAPGTDAIADVNSGDFKKVLTRMRERKDERFQTFATHGARYSVVVQTYSNLRMQAAIEQGSFKPGAVLTLKAKLAEYGIPVDKRARVNVELTRPGGSLVTLTMVETEPGTFEVTTHATSAGIYHARFIATGATLRGTPFTREQLATAAVWQGGDDPYRPPADSGTLDWCRLLQCVLNEKAISREAQDRWKKQGIDVDGIRRCLKQCCAGGRQTRGNR